MADDVRGSLAGSTAQRFLRVVVRIVRSFDLPRSVRTGRPASEARSLGAVVGGLIPGLPESLFRCVISSHGCWALGTQGGIPGRRRLDDMQQPDNDLAHGRVGDGHPG
ncbi:MAG: hypothetical protein KGS47_02525 [Chloroflexi bacterium]|nr:hypothetical protein [Chloroflexota bacterium]